MHHFNVESLRGCYQELDGKKALGTDGISKERYGLDLKRLKMMSYRPCPVRQVLIPKGRENFERFIKDIAGRLGVDVETSDFVGRNTTADA